ncbi:MAG: uridine diphosphate-N-acetylglucosamine-binding protein YvcK [Nocardioides sp.]
MLDDSPPYRQRVTALGGGHGLYASLSALRRLPLDLTAVVTVADDGGSSGRLRSEFGVLPPGDLRMALAALCGDDEWGETWAQVLQHRFAGTGEMNGHVTGNLLIVSLWELLGDHVAALDWVGRLLGARGRVLPMALTPLDISAQVSGLYAEDPERLSTVRGQVAVATSTGTIEAISLLPEDLQACPEAVASVREADLVVLGPGSWFTSVLPHLMVPRLAEALVGTDAHLVVVLNLGQEDETGGFAAADHLRVLLDHAPGLPVGTVLVDAGEAAEGRVLADLEDVAASCGARVLVADVARGDGSPRHDPEKLAAAFAGITAGLANEGR